MIPFDFEYHHPLSINDAVDIFTQLDAASKNPIYYGGGTEIISMARMNNLQFGAVIDVKDIPECYELGFADGKLVTGAGVTLTQLHESNLFPLLAQAGARVADHTIQNKITLGGNICGTIKYKEALLPLLLTECDILVAAPQGNRTVKIKNLFDQRILLNKGEFIIQIKIEEKYLGLPYIHVKRTKMDKINYPLVTICALKFDQQVRVAFSGLCSFPFRSQVMENEINDGSRPVRERVENAFKVIPDQVADDLEGSAGFRSFAAKILLNSAVNELEAR